MRILHVNNQIQAGGAETVLHQLRAAFGGTLFVADGKHYPSGVRSLYPKLLSRLWHTRLHRVVERFWPRDATTDRAFRELGSFPCDLIHLHNFHGRYATIESLAELAGRRPLVWTFHALWGITGGCDHPRECTAYQQQCGHCPQVGWWPVGPIDHTARDLQSKLAFIAPLPLHIVAPSKWLGRSVCESQIGRGWNVEVIPNGVDTDRFSPPLERRQTPVRILMINRSFRDPQKGFSMIEEAVRGIDPATVELTVAGGDSAWAAERLSRFRVQDRGYITNRIELAALYREAELFLFASPAENFPCVTLEAMASGCCVVATPTGGILEQISDGVTGFLATEISGAALGLALQRSLSDPDARRSIANAARDRAVKEYSETTMIERYRALYQKVIR